MPQTMVARINCPNCQNPFQMPLQQVVDVRADPAAKGRVLSGLVNVAVCPNCGMAGPLDMPFFYHDPDKELALVYMPMRPDRDNMQREKAIGDFTRTVMESLPAEERKAYLLQPQVFLSLDTLIEQVLQAEGITPEMIEQQQAKVDLIRRMVQAETDKALETLIEENEGSIDDEFFHLLMTNIEILRANQQDDELAKLLALRDKLLDATEEGRKIKARNQMLTALREEPTVERLIQSLVDAPDKEAREVLLTFGRPLLDYRFFQELTARIDAESDSAEKERLVALRKEILEVRDRLDEQGRALINERQALLRDLMLSSDPENLARRRLAELDRVFLNILATDLQNASEMNDQDSVKALQKIWELVLGLMEEALPADVRFFNQLLTAEDEAQVDELLEENRALITEAMGQFVEQVLASARKDENASPENVERLSLILEKVQAIVKE